MLTLREMKLWCFRPLLCTLLRLNWAKQTPGIMRTSSEKGAPVWELIRHSVLGEPLVVNLQEPMPVEKRLEYTIQATASVWEPFGMAPWDAGGMHGGGCRFCETFWTMMFQWLIRLSCRPVIINGLDRTMRMNTEYGHERIMTINTDSPRLAVTPGEWYASEMLTMMTTELRQTNGFTEMIDTIYNCRTVGGFRQINSTVAKCGSAELDDLIFRRTSFPPVEFSAGCDRNYMENYSIVWGFPILIRPRLTMALARLNWMTRFSAARVFRRTSCPPGEMETIYGWTCGLACQCALDQ